MTRPTPAAFSLAGFSRVRPKSTTTHSFFKRSEVGYFNGRFVVDAFVLLVLFKVIHKMLPLSTFTTKTTCLSGLNVVLGLLLVHFWFKKNPTIISLNKNISPQLWGGKHVSENHVSLIYVLSSLWSPFYFTLLCFFRLKKNLSYKTSNYRTWRLNHTRRLTIVHEV